jgi:iron complex outermembrane receptor protein
MFHRLTRILARVAGAAALAIMLVPAMAQDAAVQVDLPAQSLAQSIATLTRQTGVEILAPSEMVSGRQAPAVSGRLTPQQALDRLLQGSGLQAQKATGGGFVVKRLETRGEGADAQLPQVTVESTEVVDTPVGPDAGYVAKLTRAGTKTSTPLNEIPQSISIVTREQMADQNVQSMQDALRYTAGVRAEMYGVDNRGDWFTIRGGSEGSVMLDGRRRPLSGYYGNVRDEPYAYERLEVLRGPSSIMAGQNGPGGVVNLVSKRPQAEAQREIGVQLGNYEYKQLNVDLTGPLNQDGTLLYRLVALGRDTDTQVDHTSDERQFIAPSLTWRPNAETSLTLFTEYQRDESNNTTGYFPWVGTILPAPYGQIPWDTFIGEPAWDSYGGKRQRIGYELEQQLTDEWQLRHGLRYEHVDGHLRGMYTLFDGTADPFDSEFLADNRSVNRMWFASDTDTSVTSTDVLLEGHLNLGGMQHTLLVGADAFWWREVNPYLQDAATPLDVYTPTYGTFDLPPLDFVAGGNDVPIHTRQVGLLVQDQVKINERWIVMGGLRYDDLKATIEGEPEPDVDENAISKRFGVVFLAGNGWAPYVSYSESFEAQTGRGADAQPFKPKRAAQFEAGVRWSSPDERVMATGAVYHLKEKNRLTPDPNNPLFEVEGGEFTTKGLELEVVASLTKWDLIASYTFTDAKQTASSNPATDAYLGKRPHSIPEHAAAAWAVRRFSIGEVDGFRVGAGVRYIGETWDGGDLMAVPSYTLVDALLGFDQGKWRYALNATNLFDKKYIATCLERGDCWYGERRQVMASASYRW